jgi:hypothetical protein
LVGPILAASHDGIYLSVVVPPMHLLATVLLTHCHHLTVVLLTTAASPVTQPDKPTSQKDRQLETWLAVYFGFLRASSMLINCLLRSSMTGMRMHVFNFFKECLIISK